MKISTINKVMVPEPKKKQLLSSKELYIIRGKLIVGQASLQEQEHFFAYVDFMEKLLDDHSGEGCFSEGSILGWRRMCGLEE